jgi:hypothetical protein
MRHIQAPRAGEGSGTESDALSLLRRSPCSTTTGASSIAVVSSACRVQKHNGERAWVRAGVQAASRAGGEKQSVATPQAARGWAGPPCRRFKSPSC